MAVEERSKDSPAVIAAHFAEVVQGLKLQFAANTEFIGYLDRDDDCRVADFLQRNDLDAYNRWRGAVLAVRPGGKFNPLREQ